VIKYFHANGQAGSITVSSGTMVTLSWEWERVSEGYLDPGNHPMACPAMPCTFKASPPGTTTYTLRAVNASGADTESVTVNIGSAPTTLSFTFSPTSGPVATDVELSLSAAVQVTVYYDGQVLPKVVTDGGKTLRVTIPANASSGYFELRWDGQSVTASEQFTIRSPAPPSATLILHNNTGSAICYVYFSHPDEPWGDNRLGSGERVEPGQTRSWGIAAGAWDLEASDCSIQMVDQEMGVNISGTYFWQAP
jgi:PKD repeat protein